MAKTNYTSSDLNLKQLDTNQAKTADYIIVFTGASAALYTFISANKIIIQISQRFDFRIIYSCLVHSDGVLWRFLQLHKMEVTSFIITEMYLGCHGMHSLGGQCSGRGGTFLIFYIQRFFIVLRYSSIFLTLAYNLEILRFAFIYCVFI